MQKKKLLLVALMSIAVAGPVEAQGFFKKLKESFENFHNEMSGNTDSQKKTKKSKKHSNTPTLQQLMEGDMGMPEIKTQPMPEAEGWTLVRSNTIAGFKCDHYEKGGQAVRVFKKDNGDFITLAEDPDGMSREPFQSVSEGPTVSFSQLGTTTEKKKEPEKLNPFFPIGPWRLTLKTTDGDVLAEGGFKDWHYTINGNALEAMKKARKEDDSYELERQEGGCKITYPSGNAIGISTNIANWSLFKSGDKPTELFKTYEMVWYYPKSQPGKRFPYYIKGNDMTVPSGFVIDGCVYAWNPARQEADQLEGQLVGNYFYPVVLGEAIQSAEVSNSDQSNFEDLHTITYANGDKIVYIDQYGGAQTHSGRHAPPEELHTGCEVQRVVPNKHLSDDFSRWQILRRFGGAGRYTHRTKAVWTHL